MSDASVVCSNLSFAWPDDTRCSATCPSPRAAAAPASSPPNGSGKSTLLKLIAGELKPDTGSVSVTGTLGHLRRRKASPGAESRGRTALRDPPHRHPAHLATPETEGDMGLFQSVTEEFGDIILGPPGAVPAGLERPGTY